MTHSKHSPGPWHLGKNGDKCAKNHAICAGTTVIAKVYGRGYPVGEGWSEQSQADACLMAAAPELLKTLDYVRATLKLRYLDEATDDEVDEAITMADNAIAQAEGRAA